jgi:spermidine synthase
VRDLRPFWKGAAMAALCGTFFFYPWDRNLFSSGAFMYSNMFARTAKLGKRMFQKGLKKHLNILFYKDGVSSTVTVHQAGQTRSLRVNGKVEASTSGDMETQILVSYIPLFAHPHPGSALVIGLGSGITLSAAADFETVRELDCVEIEPAVVEASRFFSNENKNILEDPRVRVIIGDGRNHVRFSPNKYDVIISEPSNPWMSGVSSLFSRENYQAALGRLKPGGIYGQWLHAYQMSIDDFVMIMQTFASVFPQVNLYKISLGDYLLLGSSNPIRFDYQNLMGALRTNASIRRRTTAFSRHGENFLLGTFFFSDRELRAALETRAAVLNTDDRLSLEYSAPKFLYRSFSGEILHWLHWNEHRDLLPDLGEADLEKIRQSPDLVKVYRSNARDAMLAKYYPAAVRYLEEAVKLKTGDRELYFAAARAHEMDGQYDKAKRRYEEALAAGGDEVRIRVCLQKVALKQKMSEDPAAAKDANSWREVARLAFLAGDPLEEIEHAANRAAYEAPEDTRHYSDMAFYYFARGRAADGHRIMQSLTGRVDRDEPSFKRAFFAWQAAREIGKRRLADSRKLFEDIE